MKVPSLEVATELPLAAWDDDYRSVSLDTDTWLPLHLLSEL